MSYLNRNTEKIKIGEFNNGKRPLKLYHVTTQDRLENILKEGLNPLYENKQFDFSERLVYMGSTVELSDSYIKDLYTDALAERFKSKDDIKDTEVKFAILEIDCSKLNEEEFDLDEAFESGKNDEEYIDAYTYEGIIKPEYIKIYKENIKHTYSKVEIAECWLYFVG